MHCVYETVKRANSFVHRKQNGWFMLCTQLTFHFVDKRLSVLITFWTKWSRTVLIYYRKYDAARKGLWSSTFSERTFVDISTKRMMSIGCITAGMMRTKGLLSIHSVSRLQNAFLPIDQRLLALSYTSVFRLSPAVCDWFQPKIKSYEPCVCHTVTKWGSYKLLHSSEWSVSFC